MLIRPVFAIIVCIVHGKQLFKNVLVCKYEAHLHLLDDLSLFSSFFCVPMWLEAFCGL